MSQTVLVVEDDPKIVNLLGLYLKREGFNVASAADGREALDAATRIRPSLIILDLMLPHMDGVEVCRRLRAASDVPILMLTARVDELDKLLGLSLGADDYVTKPFSAAPRESGRRSCCSVGRWRWIWTATASRSVASRST